MGTRVLRKVRNSEYLYYVYYADKKRMEVYCGLATSSKSKRKADLVEIEELQHQKENIIQRIKELRKL